MPSLIVPGRRTRSDDGDDEEEHSTPRESTPLSTGPNDSKRARRSRHNERSSPVSENDSASPILPQNSSRIPNGKRVRPREVQEQRYQPGSIIRVKLKNFVTYSSAEFFPGPNLNMVIGPNGTGKSTLVCAICLGLGWGPQHLGRAKDISEFVKHGCAEATIEIELATRPRSDPTRVSKNPIICRTIKREGNKSFFTIQGKTVTKNQVLELARSFSIQIDNLCQFLPQDKVVEFAAMTPVELLHSTLQAAGAPELLGYHEDLKKLRSEQRKLALEGKVDKELLATLQARQEASRADVERFRQRAEVKEKITWLQRSRPIAMYREAHAAARAAKARKAKLNKELHELKKEVEPTLRSVNAKQQYHRQIQQVVQYRQGAFQAADRDAENTNNKIEKHNDKINELDHRFEAEQRGGKNKREEQKRLERGITDLKRRMEEEPEAFDAAEVNARIRDIVQELRGLKTKAEESREQSKVLKAQGQARSKEQQKVQRDLENLETSSGQQEVKLQRRSRDTYQAWQWVKENQDMFEQRVYGPPMVECSLTNPKYADAVESLFQNNDFLFFTVQNRNDFRILQRELNGKMKLHEISLKVCTAKREQFQPPMPEAEMRELGFEGYAIDFLNGPEPLLAGLCSEKRLHKTPIGFNSITDDQYRRLQDTGLGSWVAGSHSYLITRRREYGDAGISSRVRSIRKATVWTDQPVDVGRRRELASKNAEIQSDIDEIRKQLASLNPAHEEVQKQGKQLEKEREDLQTEKDKRQKALTEFRALPTKLAQLDAKLVTVVEAIEEVKARLLGIGDERADILMKKTELTIKSSQAVSQIRGLHVALLEAEILQIEARSDFETLESRNQDVKDMLTAKQAEEKQAVEENLRYTEKARVLIEEVKKLMTESKEIPRFHAFIQGLSTETTVEQLEADIESAKAQLDLTHEGDVRIVEVFENRERQIVKTRERIVLNQDGRGEVDASITEVRGKWEPEVDGIVARISNAFSDSFARIGCAGQVSVYKASAVDEDDGAQREIQIEEAQGNGLDFANWAIHIYVKFRESEPLSLLDSHRQSGGERAVSTIFYLMALQTLSRAPFRVVDEINQGMDPRNERMVHGRMVDIACGENGEGSGSQYFLITPKLLSGLKYKRGMKVLCIVSGEQMPSPEDVERPGGIGKVDFREWIKRAQKLELNDRRVDSGFALSSSFDGASQVTEVGA